MPGRVYDPNMAFERAVWLAAIAGCYSPTATSGAPCDDRMNCPSGQLCLAGRCEPEGTMLDDAALDAPADAPPDSAVDAIASWSTPVAIPGINTAAAEQDPSMTADRLTIVFERDNNLFMGRRANVNESFVVTELTTLNTSGAESSPEISADGNTLWLTSDRLVAGDEDVYVSTRVLGFFTTPTRVDELSLAGADEDDIGISPDGLTAIVSRNGLHRATRAKVNDAWSTPVTIDNLAGDPNAPSITSAGDVYYHAGTTRDLFVIRRLGTAFGAAMPLDDFNTSGREASPFIWADETRLLFERDGDLYESLK